MVAQFNVLGTLTPNRVHLLAAVYFQFHLKERWGMDVHAGINVRAQYCGFDMRF